MPTPSLYPLYMKAQSGGGGDPVQTFTSEPISLDLVTADLVSVELNSVVLGLTLQAETFTLDLDSAVAIAQQGGTLSIDNASITLEIDQ